MYWPLTSLLDLLVALEKSTLAVVPVSTGLVVLLIAGLGTRGCRDLLSLLLCAVNHSVVQLARRRLLAYLYRLLKLLWRLTPVVCSVPVSSGLSVSILLLLFVVSCDDSLLLFVLPVVPGFQFSCSFLLLLYWRLTPAVDAAVDCRC
jgi:hypothetical protein